MAIPGVRDFVGPTLRLIAAGVSRTPEIASQVGDRLGLTEEERSVRLPNGQTEVGNRVAFVLRYAGPAGVTRMTAPRTYELTEFGRELLSRTDAEIADFILRRGRVMQQGDAGFQSAPAMAAASDLPPDIVPEEVRLADAARAARSALERDLLESVRILTAEQFERLMKSLLERLGYGVAELHKGGARDEGVDGILRQDVLGLERVYLQAKRYAADRPVGPALVREFVGALTNAGATKGVLATTSSFTTAARDALPKGNSSARIRLIDGAELAGLMVDHEVGVRTEQVIRVQVVDLTALADREP